LQRRRVSLDRAAILVRAQFQTREFEDRFIAIGMPYRITQAGLRAVRAQLDNR
jgi:DNA helicase-2/ATP-dependent DNA helicase PcrA